MEFREIILNIFGTGADKFSHSIFYDIGEKDRLSGEKVPNVYIINKIERTVGDKVSLYQFRESDLLLWEAQGKLEENLTKTLNGYDVYLNE